MEILLFLSMGNGEFFVFMRVWHSGDEYPAHELKLLAHDGPDGRHFRFAACDEFAGPNGHRRLGFQLSDGRHIESSPDAGTAAFGEPRFAIDAGAARIHFGIQARITDDLAPGRPPGPSPAGLAATTTAGYGRRIQIVCS